MWLMTWVWCRPISDETFSEESEVDVQMFRWKSFALKKLGRYSCLLAVVSIQLQMWHLQKFPAHEYFLFYSSTRSGTKWLYNYVWYIWVIEVVLMSVTQCRLLLWFVLSTWVSCLGKRTAALSSLHRKVHPICPAIDYQIGSNLLTFFFTICHVCFHLKIILKFYLSKGGELLVHPCVHPPVDSYTNLVQRMPQIRHFGPISRLFGPRLLGIAICQLNRLL